MTSKVLTWWRNNNKWLTVVGIITGIIAFIVLLFIIGLENGTGFGEYSTVTVTTTARGVTTQTTYQGGKTLWDWLQLLIVPLALAIIAVLFNLASTRTDQKIAMQRYEQDKQIATQRYEQDQHIALDKQREDLLQTYLDHMSELLLEKQLHSPTPPDEARNVARVRTITILSQLDTRRIGYVFAFLREAGLMSTTSESIVSLKQANLNTINFSQAQIDRVDLRDANLSKANLSKADLTYANLSEAILQEADLSEAILYGADFTRANLTSANLTKANLCRADLSGADLWIANLSGAALIDAKLNEAKLFKVDFSSADLSYADLSEAFLSEANFSEAKFNQTKLLRVRGLSESELETYKSRGAIIS
jgi:hypothetical protein